MGEIFDKRFPWIQIDQSTFPPTMVDTRTGETQPVGTVKEVWSFIADHSAAEPGKGLGDRIHAALDWAGFRRCMSCAQRQAFLNALGHLRLSS